MLAELVDEGLGLVWVVCARAAHVAAAVSSQPQASQVPALYRWLLQAHQSHPRIYAFASVLFLLGIGALIGLGWELLSALRSGNRTLPHAAEDKH